MEFKYIAFSLIGILAFLFIFAPKFRKTEKEIGQLEAKYVDALRTYQKSKNENDLDNLKTLGNRLGTLLKKKQNEIDDMITRDLS